MTLPPSAFGAPSGGPPPPPRILDLELRHPEYDAASPCNLASPVSLFSSISHPHSFTAPPAMSSFTHLRRRSSVAELTQLCSPISPTGSQFSDVTAYEDEDEPSYPTTLEKMGDYSAVHIDDDPESRGWRVASTADKTPRRRVSTLLWTGSLLVATAMAGWLAGSAGRRETIHASGAPASHLPKSATEKCNPYEQHGVLYVAQSIGRWRLVANSAILNRLVNTSVPSLNMWQPIGAPESCEPVDYTTQLLEMQVGLKTTNPTLDSLRNRTVLIFGDSVDRECVLLSHRRPGVRCCVCLG